MKILVSGTIAYDRIMNFAGYFKDNIIADKIHTLNVSFFINEMKVSFGGTAGNIAYNLSLLGVRPTVLAKVGTDFAAYRTWMHKNHIDMTLLQIVKTVPTPVAYIITDKADNQISAFYPGAVMQPYVLGDKKMNGDLAIIAPDNVTSMLRLSAVYQKNHVPYICDPGQQIAALQGLQLRRLIKGAAVFVSNDYELQLVLQKTNLKFSELISQVPLVVTTLGSKGSIVYQQGKKIVVPAARPKKIVDPTGAGDAYRAGLIYGLLKQWPLEKIGRFAGLVAVYTVEKQGTQTHHFTWNQLRARYRQNFNQSL